MTDKADAELVRDASKVDPELQDWVVVDRDAWEAAQRIAASVLADEVPVEVTEAAERVRRHETEPSRKVYGECPDDWDSQCEYFMHAEMLDREIISDYFLPRLAGLDNALELVDANKEIARLKDELQDWKDSAKTAAGEMCGDEKHCTCVPLLRKRIAELEGVVESMDQTISNLQDCVLGD